MSANKKTQYRHNVIYPTEKKVIEILLHWPQRVKFASLVCLSKVS